MHFSEPMPAVIAWFYFLTSYIVPKAYIERVGLDEFTRKPIGSGPYKMVEYQAGARGRVRGAWPPIGARSRRLRASPSNSCAIRRHVVAAIESGRVDLAVDVPVREAQRLKSVPGVTTSIDAIADVTLLQMRKTGGFVDDRVRLAAHHAINKEAISKAFFGGAAKPISVPAAHGDARLSRELHVRVFGREIARAAEGDGLRPAKSHRHQIRLAERRLSQRFRSSAGAGADVEEGRHQCRTGDDRAFHLSGTSAGQNLARSDIVQLGQRDGRSGNVWRQPARPEVDLRCLQNRRARSEDPTAARRDQSGKALRRPIVPRTNSRPKRATRSRSTRR